MQRSSTIRPHRRTSHRRAGMLSVWGAFALTVVGLCAAAAINRGIVSLAWSHTQVCADAAALAACRELLTDDLLRPEYGSAERDIARCRSKAIRLADRYSHHRSADVRMIPALQLNQITVLQRVWSASRGQYMTVTDSLHPDAVRVRLSNQYSSDEPRRITSAGLFGPGRAAISCEATACLHGHIHGFRTGPGIAIPLAPLAIPDDPDQRLAGTWSSTDADGRDEYSWDQERRELRRRSDGLVELALTVQRTGAHIAPGQLIPVRICESDHPTPVADRVRNGLQHADAIAAGLELLSFPRTDSSAELDAPDFEELGDVLGALIGEKRMFPLVSMSTLTDVVLTDVVAARILAVHREGSSLLHVQLQPTVLSTASAVVAADQSVPENRYVRKVTLLR